MDRPHRVGLTRTSGVPSIEIIAVPPGEAPEGVRAAWVGMVLPLSRTGYRRMWTSGVVTGARSRLGRFWAGLTGRWRVAEGYLVDASVAIALLEKHRPEAARWWRANAPHLVKSNRQFLFAADVCRELPEPGPPA
jgi:hypothetical protein